MQRFVYAETFWPNGFGPYESVQRAIRDERWKLARGPGDAEHFFDLRGREFEGPDLLLGQLTDEQRAAYESLRRQLAALIGG